MTPDQTNAEVLRLLRLMQADVAQLRAEVLAMRAERADIREGGKLSPGGQTASDHDLDGQHGDPTVKKDPSTKYWDGDSHVGYRFSECPPRYLDAMAKYKDACAHMAERDQDEKRRKNARYMRMDAARARGWAERLRRSGGASPRRNDSGSEYDGYAGNYGGDEDAAF